MWQESHQVESSEKGRARARPWSLFMLLLITLVTVPHWVGCRDAALLDDARGKSPSQVVEQYIDLIKRGEAERAYALRTAEIRENLSFESFKRFVQQGNEGDATGWDVVVTIRPVRETVLSSQRAEVEVKYRRQGETLTMTITCIKEEGVWKLGRFG